jgi:flagellar M-ring protein FliF
VVLTLRHRTLAEGEDEAIRNLVAAAVDGLSAKQVTLVDANGHQPLGLKSPESARQGMEQALEAKLIETLEPVTGAGNVRASVTVDYDPTSTETTEESYDPAKVVTLSMQRTEQSTGPQPVAAGVPGTASNAPNSQDKPVYPQQTSPPQTAKSETGTYGASKTVRHVSQGPGHIRRLTAAIVVNDRLMDPHPASGTQKIQTAAWQPRTAQELRTLTSLAQAAIGYDAARGDLLSVEDLTFDENRVTAKDSTVERARSLMERSPLLVKYGSLLAGLLLLILLGIRPALGRATKVKPVPARNQPAELTASVTGTEQESSGALGSLGNIAGTPDLERQRVQHVFEQVTETLKRDPAQSSRLLQSWIHSE